MINHWMSSIESSRTLMDVSFFSWFIKGRIDLIVSNRSIINSACTFIKKQISWLWKDISSNILHCFFQVLLTTFPYSINDLLLLFFWKMMILFKFFKRFRKRLQLQQHNWQTKRTRSFIWSDVSFDVSSFLENNNKNTNSPTYSRVHQR